MRVSPRLLKVLMPVESWVLKGVPWTEVRARTAERPMVDCTMVAELYHEHRFLSESDNEAVVLLVQQCYPTLRIMDYVERAMRAACGEHRNTQGESVPLNETQTNYLAESLALYVEWMVRTRPCNHSTPS